MFVLIFLALLGSVYGYSGWRLLPWLPSPAHWAAASVLLLLLLLPLLLFRLRSRPRLAWLTDLLAWIAYLSMGFFTVCSTPAGRARPGRPAPGPGPPHRSGARRPASTWRPSSLAVAVTGCGFYQARRTPEVRRVEVPIESLPPALAGPAHRADQRSPRGSHHQGSLRGAHRRPGPRPAAGPDRLHRGSRRRLRRAARTSHGRPCAAHRPPSDSTSAPATTSTNSDLERWTVQARRLGFDVLINETRRIDCGGARIALAGATDFSAGELVPAPRVGPVRGPRRQRRRRFAHPARPTSRAASRRPPTPVATCNCPVTPTEASSFRGSTRSCCSSPSSRGLHKVRDTWIYVHRGTGYWGPPLRLGAPSEIALLTLTRAPDGVHPV